MVNVAERLFSTTGAGPHRGHPARGSKLYLLIALCLLGLKTPRLGARLGLWNLLTIAGLVMAFTKQAGGLGSPAGARARPAIGFPARAFPAPAHGRRAPLETLP